MDDSKALALYEKMYFHEFDAREKIVARLQMVIGALALSFGYWAYIFSRIDFTKTVSVAAHGIFLVAFVSASVVLVVSASSLARGLCGHVYDCVPDCEKLEEYRQVLISTYEPYPESEKLVEKHYVQFLIKYYSECARTNALRNSVRYELIHESLLYLIIAMPFLCVSGLTFVLGDMGVVKVP